MLACYHNYCYFFTAQTHYVMSAVQVSLSKHKNKRRSLLTLGTGVGQWDVFVSFNINSNHNRWKSIWPLQAKTLIDKVTYYSFIYDMSFLILAGVLPQKLATADKLKVTSTMNTLTDFSGVKHYLKPLHYGCTSLNKI